MAFGGRQGGEGGSVREESLKMYLFTFLLWAGAKASGGGGVSRSLWDLGPQLGQVALHLGLEWEPWPLHSSGMSPEHPIGWAKRARGPQAVAGACVSWGR